MGSEDTHGDANALLAEISGIGVDEIRGGYSRSVFSSPELQLRDWFVGHARARGLAVETDGNGIIWAWWDVAPANTAMPDDAARPGQSGATGAALPADPDRAGAILTGSHLDSVPGGGNYDGPLGVASALAAVDVLRDRGIAPSRSLAVAVFPEEEGSRFGLACLGSRLMVGAADPDAVRALTDDTGISYAEAATAAGFDPTRIRADAEGLERISAFVELHVEQGRGLIDEDRPVALAGGILGHGRWHMRIEGRGDHAGATLMADRQDPVVVAAAAIQSLREQALVVPGARGTIGRINVTPGGTNVIASAVDLWIDVRHRDDAAVARIVEAVSAETAHAGEAEGCTVTVTQQSLSPTVDFDHDLRRRMAAVLPDAPVLDTGAGHDAGVLASAIPTGMLFVRNPTGASHTPAEYSAPEDIAAGVLALADVLQDLLTN